MSCLPANSATFRGNVLRLSNAKRYFLCIKDCGLQVFFPLVLVLVVDVVLDVVGVGC